jgi:hypothetical protein
MLECQASSGDTLFAHAMSGFASSSDPEPIALDRLPRDDSSGLGDYAQFLLEQQEGYCQLV